MKKFFFSLLFLPVVILSLPKDLLAQNGVTMFNMPTGYTSAQLQYKNALTIDNASNKWVGFKSIGVGKFDGTNWTMFNISNSLLPCDTVNALAVDASNNIWIGTNNGLAKFDGTNWTIFNTSNSAIISKYVLSVAVQGSNIWIGTKSGVSKFNGTTFTNYSVSNSGLAGDTVQCFAFESNGDTWIGTSNRLSKLVGITWTTFGTFNSVLTGNNILSLYYDGGNIWIGTKNNGLYKYSANTLISFFTLYPGTSSFIWPNNSIYSISKGPSGGVSYFQGGALIEIVNNKPEIYYFPNSVQLGSPLVCLAYDYLNSSFWLVHKSNLAINGRKLFSFSHQNYNGFGLGLTFDNIKYLDINQVSTAILNRGDMNWDLTQGKYEVPKGGGAGTVFSSGLWIGGFDNGGNLHQAAMTYRQTGSDYWPGPLDTTNGTIDTTVASQYDKIWKIDRFKIEEFIYYFNNGQVQNGNYIPDNDIITWPARGTGNYTRNLAPFVDVNSNGIYDPMTGGDYPIIKGDQELYWIFNDNLTAHGETGGVPLKVEVHASAYAFTCPTIADSLKTMNYTTLYEFQIFNRSVMNYDSVYLGMWIDHDLGLYSNDFVGCQPQYNFGFAYNGDSIDGSGLGTYGLRPPISSTAVLNGPIAYPNDGVDNNNDGAIDEVGEKNLMTCFHYYNGSDPCGEPASAMDHYNYLRGRWKDSTHITFGGSGYYTGPPTNFMYSDLPCITTGWSEVTVPNVPADRRYVMGCGPFKFNAGSKVDLDYAIVYSRDTTIPFGTPAYYQQAINDVTHVTNWFNTNNFPSCLQLNVGTNDVSTSLDMTLNIYPNPTNDILNIDYKQTNLNTMMEIYDITGKQIYSSRLESFGKNHISVKELSDGLYFIRIIDGGEIYSKKFIKE